MVNVLEVREMDDRPEIRWAIGPVTEGILCDHVQHLGWLRAGVVLSNICSHYHR